MGKIDGVAEIRVSKIGRQPTVTIGVPDGLKMKDITRLLEVVSEEILPDLTGCQPCNSGVPIFIETFDDVVRIDLQKFQRITG